MKVIEVKNVVKKYKIKGTEKIAINDVSYSIDKGDIVGLIGLNGAGKSTTIKLLTGIIEPSSGSIAVQGVAPYNSRKKICQSYGVMFGQRTNLWWDLPLIDSLFIYGRMYKLKKTEILEKIHYYEEIFNIDFLNVPVRQLSFGQRVMGDILVAIIHDPSIVFLDEATIALDVFNRKRVLDLITAINEAFSTTIIITSHILTDIEAVCNRILLLDSGKLIYDGSLDYFVNQQDISKKVEVIFSDDRQMDIIRDKLVDVKVKKMVTTNNRLLLFCSKASDELSVIVDVLDNSGSHYITYAISDISLEDRLLYLMENQ